MISKKEDCILSHLTTEQFSTSVHFKWALAQKREQCSGDYFLCLTKLKPARGWHGELCLQMMFAVSVLDPMQWFFMTELCPFLMQCHLRAQRAHCCCSSVARVHRDVYRSSESFGGVKKCRLWDVQHLTLFWNCSTGCRLCIFAHFWIAAHLYFFETLPL